MLKQKLLWARYFSLALASACALISSPAAQGEEKPHYFVKNLSLAPNDQASLQRGAQIYFNYCSGCHSLKYIRYSEVAHLTGVENANHQIYANLIQKDMIFDENGDIHQTIQTALGPEDAKKFFGVVPPDLTNETRIHSPAWVYNFLRGFYKDPAQPTGANNLIQPNTAMPNVLLPLRGETIPIFDDKNHFDHWRTLQPGKLRPLDFDQAMYDLTNFLNRVADPYQNLRFWLGLGALAFLLILFMMIYFLFRTFRHDEEHS